MSETSLRAGDPGDGPEQQQAPARQVHGQGALGRTAVRGAIAGVVAAAVVLGGGTAAGLISFGGSGTEITAVFDHSIGVYKGSDLRILGVRVGTVTGVHPEGTQVRVTLRLDHGVKVPADASAVVVAPSVVADRYVQLTPAYSGGARMADHAVIPEARTASPLEIDQLYQSIDQLATALGPNGANKDGALSDLLNTGAANLKGNGSAIGNSIDQFGKAAQTLNGSSSQLFATLTSLQQFTAMLKQNNDQVASATNELSTVSGFLAQDKDDLASALSQLATALGQVQTFIASNRAELSKVVGQLKPITQTLADQQASLSQMLNLTPLALDNFVSAYNPKTQTIDGRADLNELSLPLPLSGSGGGSK